MQYNTPELISMITSNSLAAIHYRLVEQGKISGTSQVTADAVTYAIQERMDALPTEQFLAWFEQLLDVPVDQQHLYASELNTIRDRTGQSPASIVVDQMRKDLGLPDPNAPENKSVFKLQTAKNVKVGPLGMVMLAFAVIGVLAVLRMVFKVIVNAMD